MNRWRMTHEATVGLKRKIGQVTVFFADTTALETPKREK
jgi:hypothetical protein